MKAFDAKDVQIDVHHWGMGEYAMRLMHRPTGMTVFGGGKGDEFRVRDPLMLQLAEKVRKIEGWE